VVLGLLASGMTATAEGVVRNLLHLVSEFGMALHIVPAISSNAFEPSFCLSFRLTCRFISSTSSRVYLLMDRGPVG
jgi:hypothetical protein